MGPIVLCMMLGLVGLVMDDTVASAGNQDPIVNQPGDVTGGYAHTTTNDFVHDIVNHPAFKGLGPYLLPWDDSTAYHDTPLKNVRALLPYHSHVDPDIVVGALNHMIDAINDGQTIFYDIYPERQKQADPSKKATGLFFFRGRPGAPFAVVCPGGGFAYVGSLHEGFPHAVELSRRGYNAFVLKYRVGNGLRATEDLAAAISYIFANAKKFGVSTEDYALWGSSAGARMVGDIALEGVAAFGGGDLPQPCIVVIAYTGHTSFSGNYPPAFVVASADDPIASVPVVDRRVANLSNAGVEVAYRRYEHAGHGFGLASGTDAAGWLEHAIQFWESHLAKW